MVAAFRIFRRGFLSVLKADCDTHLTFIALLDAERFSEYFLRPATCIQKFLVEKSRHIRGQSSGCHSRKGISTLGLK